MPTRYDVAFAVLASIVAWLTWGLPPLDFFVVQGCMFGAAIVGMFDGRSL